MPPCLRGESSWPEGRRPFAYLRLALALALAILLLPVAAARADDAVADRLLERAGMFAGRSQYPQAIELLDDVLERRPGGRRAYELRGYCRMKLDDWEAACRDFERGDARATYHDVNYGYCLKKSGRLQQALDAFRLAAGTLKPSDTWAAYAREQAKALAHIEDARTVLVLLDAGDHLLAQGKAGVLGRAGAGEEAAIVLDGALAAHASAGDPAPLELRVLGITVEGAAGGRVILYHRGEALLDERWPLPSGPEGARTSGAPDGGAGVALDGITCDLRIALALAPGPDGAVTVAHKERRVGLEAAAAQARAIEERWRAGDHEEAIALARRAVEAEPGIAWFARRLAELYAERAAETPTSAETRDVRRALQASADEARHLWLAAQRKIAAICPADPRAALNAAAAAIETGELPEAEHHYRAVLRAVPNHPLALAGLAQVLARAGRGREALAAAERALVEHPRWPYAHVVRGDAHLALGDAKAALVAYERAVELDPTQGEWIYGKMSAALNRGGANAEAIRAAEAKVQAGAVDAASLFALGTALLRGLRFEEAQAILEQALAHDDALPGAHALAGVAAELAGDAKEALRHYRRAEALTAADGGSEPALKALAARRGDRLIALAKALKDDVPVRAPAPRPLAEAEPEPLRERALAALAAVRAVHATLADGLARLPPLADGELTEAEVEALARVARLVEAAPQDPEAALALGLLAAEVASPRPEAPAIDGGLDGWLPADRLAGDPEGDQAAGADARADLTEVLAACAGDRLYVALRTAEVPDPDDTGYWIEVRGEPTYGTIAIGITGGEVKLIQALPGRDPREREGPRTGVRWAAGGVIEMEVPLRWLRGARRVSVYAHTFDPKTAAKLDEAAEQRPIVRLDDGYAPALLLLFRLAERAALEPADRVALAIALAGGEALAIGGAEAEERATSDAVAMLALARRLDADLAKRGWTPLSKLPLEALLTWACRSVQHRPATPAGAIRYAISPRALEAMTDYARRHDLIRLTPGETVEAIERHLASPLRWQYTSAASVERGVRLMRGDVGALSERERDDLDKFVRPCSVDGMRLTTDGHFTQDLLFDYLVATDALVGHCGNMAQATVDLCRALGIPATIVQGREESSVLYQNPHAFPIWYDGRVKAWRSVQGQRYTGPKALALYFFLPLSPRTLPPQAAPTGVGTHWFRIDTTYEQTGLTFRRGYDATWYRAWLQSVARPDR